LNTDAILTPEARQFVDSILTLAPKIAVFDCDGTLWSGDSGADFFYWEIDRHMLQPKVAEWALARYQDYLAGKVGEEEMCGEMVTINAGLREELLEEAAEEFFSSLVAKRIFPEMLQLTHALTAAGCELWAVSSTNLWAVRAGVKRFGIPAENVLAASVHVERGRATHRLIRVPSGLAKAVAIHEVVGRPVDVCLGNSIHDVAMMEVSGHSVAVNPNADLEFIAKKKGWRIYWPHGTR
jgi:phosphoserine phosphatase